MLKPLQFKPKHKKAQVEFSVLTFVAVIIGLVIVAPFILKMVNSILTPFSSSLGNQSAEAGSRVALVQSSFVGFWDFVIIIAFLINVILLMISTFLVDTHPIFLVLFILFGIFLFIFAPEVVSVLDKIYEQDAFEDPSGDGTSISQDLQMVDFLRNNLMLIVLGIYFIVGVILYAKFRIFSKGY